MKQRISLGSSNSYFSSATAKFVDRAEPDPCADGYAINWLNEWNTEARNYFNGDIVADWNNNVDLTDEHAEESKASWELLSLVMPMDVGSVV